MDVGGRVGPVGRDVAQGAAVDPLTADVEEAVEGEAGRAQAAQFLAVQVNIGHQAPGDGQEGKPGNKEKLTGGDTGVDVTLRPPCP